jgi:3-deoxy-D-manno-octulosonic-acid transferase
MNNVYYGLYNLSITLASLPLASLAALYLALRPQHLRGLSQRLGNVPSSARRRNGDPRIWIHASSLGEVGVAEAIINELRSLGGVSIIVSTYTWDGYELAKERLGGRAEVLLFPVDVSLCVAGALRAVRPDVYVAVETEIWPNFLHAAHSMGIRTVLANGRISPKSLRRFLRIRPFFVSILSSMDLISMTGRRQAERMIELGAPRQRVKECANAKFGLLMERAEMGRARVEKLRLLLSIPDQAAVFVAGSIRRYEESVIINAWKKMLADRPDSLCVLAPRHMKRVEPIERLLEREDVSYQRWSAIKSERERRASSLVLVDTLGDLFYLYGLATVVFCGASLVNRGGQNVMEPAAWGVAPMYGPYMEDFFDAAEMLETHGGALRVQNGNELIKKALWLIDNPDKRKELGKRALDVARHHAGAARETAASILSLLQKGQKQRVGQSFTESRTAG